VGIADGGMAGGSTFFCIMRKFYKLPHDTKTLRGDAQGLPQRSEGTQTQRKLSLESDAFAAQNPAKQDSYSLFSELLLKFCRIFEIYIYFQFTY